VSHITYKYIVALAGEFHELKLQLNLKKTVVCWLALQQLVSRMVGTETVFERTNPGRRPVLRIIAVSRNDS
jgi:hypothetical protein